MFTFAVYLVMVFLMYYKARFSALGKPLYPVGFE